MRREGGKEAPEGPSRAFGSVSAAAAAPALGVRKMRVKTPSEMEIAGRERGNGAAAACGEQEENKIAVNNPAPWRGASAEGRRRGRAEEHHPRVITPVITAPTAEHKAQEKEPRVGAVHGVDLVPRGARCRRQPELGHLAFLTVVFHHDPTFGVFSRCFPAFLPCFSPPWSHEDAACVCVPQRAVGTEAAAAAKT